MSKPKINVRMEHVTRKGDRRAKDRRKGVVMKDTECRVTNEDLQKAGLPFQGSDRDWLKALGAQRTDFATGLTNFERLKFATELCGGEVDGPAYKAGRTEGQADVWAQIRKIVDPGDAQHLNPEGLLKALDGIKKNNALKLDEYLDSVKFQQVIDEVRIDVDTDQYIKELVKANMRLIDEKAELAKRLMHYDWRRLDGKTVGRWLDPDPHLQAENERLRLINAKLHDALHKEKA